MGIAKKVATIAVTSALLLGGGMTAAAAAGVGGGDFTCTMSGIPGWGTVRSQYNHPTKEHWATAVGSGRQTITKPAGTEANAAVGRAVSGNACYWGTN